MICRPRPFGWGRVLKVFATGRDHPLSDRPALPPMVVAQPWNRDFLAQSAHFMIPSHNSQRFANNPL
jgi:hypothetical protein